MKLTDAGLQLSKNLFWDVAFQDIDMEKHSSFIIERVISRGKWEEFQSLLSFYGTDKIKTVLLTIRYLDRKTLAFCSTYFGIQKEQFRCYKQKLLNHSHWNY